MKHYCECGWAIYGTPPFTVRCGQCQKTVQVSEGEILIIAQAKPPLWVRLLKRLSTNDDIGLGATIKRIAAKFGGDRFKEWSTKIGLPCGCTEREVELNSLYPNQHYRQP